MSLSMAFAAMSVSDEFDETRAGITRQRAAEMAIMGIRYLCFTHDAGPEDCVRPSVGLCRKENLGTSDPVSA